MSKNTTHTLPPREIFDVLHEAECAGVEIPPIVDKWWQEETAVIWDNLSK